MAIVINGAPTSEAPRSALAFASAALAQGHSLHSVFLYHDAVGLAWDREADSIADGWSKLAEETGVILNVCVAAADRRRFPAAEPAAEKASGIRAGFVIAGLGQLIDAAASADRTVTFSG